MIKILFPLIASSLLVGCGSEIEQTPSRVVVGEIKNEVKSTPNKASQIELIKTSAIKLTEKERTCLAKNLYHEAGVEDFHGKIAVAQVTLNRVKHPTRWKSDICSTVYQKAQFSWTLEKKKVKEQPKGKLWNDSLEAVKSFENGVRIKNLNATFYHTDYIKTPKWVDHSKKITQIGQHIFYKDDKKV
jgi:spore germination cell wall hydrolase CwlJ-like protein